MNLEHLRAVSAVARHGSITLAARELHMTQSGVSRQLQRVEQELGVELFSRLHGRLELTAVGERFLRFAADTLREYDEIRRDLNNPSTDVAGPLAIAASSTPGEFLVGSFVARFVELHPQVHARVTITDTAAVIADVLERRCDVGFAGDRVVDERLHFQPVDEDEVVLVVPVGHPFASSQSVSLHELAGESFIDREAGSGTLRTVRRAVASRGLSMPPYRVVMELGTTHAIVTAVAGGAGLGWVSKQAIQGRDLTRVEMVRIRDLPLNRSIYMVHDTRRTLPSVARAFVDWIVATR